MSGKTAPKRSACDRCRSQKLRCLRSAHGEVALGDDEACSRCVRLSVDCITSSTKRPGRPRKAPPPLTASEGPGECNRTYSKPSPTGTVSTGEGAYCSPAATTGPWSSTDWSVGDDATDLAMIDDFAIPNDIAHYLEQHNPAGAPDWSLLGQTQPSPQVPPPPPPTLAPTLASNRTPTLIAAGSTSQACRLSDIYADLCRQAFNLQSSYWDISTSLRLSSDPAAMLSASSSADIRDPLASIIKASTEFCSLLSSIQATASDRFIHEAIDQTSASTPDSTITEPWIIISCFIVIVTIYDTVLKKFCLLTQAQNQDSVGGYSSETAGTNLYLGNVAIPASLATSGRLLHGLVESHMQTIEVLLGLPSEFCVSRKMSRSEGHRPSGILSSQKSLTLLMVSMQADTRHCGSHLGAVGAIESLRESLQTVLHII